MEVNLTMSKSSCICKWEMYTSHVSRICINLCLDIYPTHVHVGLVVVLTSLISTTLGLANLECMVMCCTCVVCFQDLWLLLVMCVFTYQPFQCWCHDGKGIEHCYKIDTCAKMLLSSQQLSKQLSHLKKFK